MSLELSAIKNFRQTVYRYYHRHQRDLPWRKNLSAYRVLVAEVMLQQTQAERVVAKYNLFLKQFSSFAVLARAPFRQILAQWQGLGYNRRALALQQTAKIVSQQYGGKLPDNADALENLPGIGPSTAQAILAYAFNQPAVFIETNIRTVFLHHFFPQQKNISDQQLLPLIAQTLDRKDPRRWYSALMDYGTMLKKQYGNANVRSVHYTKQSRFQGSLRQTRGQILKILLASPLSEQEIIRRIQHNGSQIKVGLVELQREGLIGKRGTKFQIA